MNKVKLLTATMVLSTLFLTTATRAMENPKNSKIENKDIGKTSKTNLNEPDKDFKEYKTNTINENNKDINKTSKTNLNEPDKDFKEYKTNTINENNKDINKTSKTNLNEPNKDFKEYKTNTINENNKDINKTSKTNLKLEQKEIDYIIHESDKIFYTMKKKFNKLVYRLKSYTERILPKYYLNAYNNVNGELKDIYTIYNLDTKSTFKEAIYVMFKESHKYGSLDYDTFLDQSENYFKNAHDEYKNKCSEAINSYEQGILKKEYIEKCKEKIKEIRDYLIKKILSDTVYFFANYEHDVCSRSSFYECSNLNHIENLVEKLRKNKEEYKAFYEKYKNKENITDNVKEQFIKNFKDMVQLLNKKDENLEVRNNNAYTLEYLVTSLKKYPYERSKTKLEELSKAVEKLIIENNRILNSNITHKDILNYYDKLIDIAKKIHEYANIISVKVAEDNYMANLLLHKTSWMNQLIKDNIDKDALSLIPKEAWV